MRIVKTYQVPILILGILLSSVAFAEPDEFSISINYYPGNLTKVQPILVEYTIDVKYGDVGTGSSRQCRFDSQFTEPMAYFENRILVLELEHTRVAGNKCSDELTSGIIETAKASASSKSSFFDNQDPLEFVRVQLRVKTDQGVVTANSRDVDFDQEKVQDGNYRMTDGLYSSPDHQNQGILLTQQGEKIVVFSLAYDAAGQPEWLYAAGPRYGSLFHADLYRLENGECLTCVPDAEPVTLDVVGKLTLGLEVSSVTAKVNDGDYVRYRHLNFGQRSFDIEPDRPGRMPSLAGEWVIKSLTPSIPSIVINIAVQSRMDPDGANKGMVSYLGQGAGPQLAEFTCDRSDLSCGGIVEVNDAFREWALLSFGVPEEELDTYEGRMLGDIYSISAKQFILSLDGCLFRRGDASACVRISPVPPDVRYIATRVE